MTKYQAVVFDMDGTLADTSLGIYNCHKYANVEMGLTEPTLEKLAGIIGGPLLQTYKERFGFNEIDAQKAVNIYRERYAQKGIYEAEIYEGIEELLIYLKTKGYKLAVATLKAEKFAKVMLENMGIAKYFDVIRGVDDQDKLSKSQLIELCTEEMEVDINSAVLVGDSKFDGIGANQLGVDFIAVTYGFDFVDDKDARDYSPVFIAETPTDIQRFL